MTKASEEWKAHWLLVLAAMAGYSFHMIATYSTGLFMDPLEQEFGWSRTEVTAGLIFPAILSVPMSPVVGALIDRWGSRRIAILGSILLAASVTAFGLANGSLVQWLALWAIFGLVSLGVQATVWTAAVLSVFTAGRGLALGITISGGALAAILMPPLTFWLIEELGWRGAFAALGLGWGGIVLILVVFFLFDAHDHSRKRSAAIPNESSTGSALPGLSIKEAARSIVLWRIASASFLTMAFGIGIIVHQVPILTEAGVTKGHAALLASLSGIAGVCGKVATGHLMDRRDAGMIGGLTLGVGAVGFMLLLEFTHAPIAIAIAMFIIGYSTGAKLQISAYLTSRYGGLRSFGKIFGVMVSMIGIGSALGPLLASATHDIYGSYSPLLLIAIPGAIVSGLLIIGLGPYPKWDGSAHDIPTPTFQAASPPHAAP